MRALQVYAFDEVYFQRVEFFCSFEDDLLTVQLFEDHILNFDGNTLRFNFLSIEHSSISREPNLPAGILGDSVPDSHHYRFLSCPPWVNIFPICDHILNIIWKTHNAY